MTKLERRALLYFVDVVRGPKRRWASKLWPLAINLLPADTGPPSRTWAMDADIAESMAWTVQP